MRPLLDLSSTNTRPSLEAQWENIERLCESNEGFMGDLADAVRNFFGDAAAYLSNVFATDDSSDVIRFSVDRNVITAVGKADPATLKGITLRQPAGIKVSIDDWADTVKDTQAIVSTLDKNVLTPTLKMLAILISSPETLAARNANIASYKIQIPDLGKVKQNLAKGRKDGSDKNRAEFFELYKTSRDYSGVEYGFAETVKEYSKLARKDVKQAANRIAEIVDKIVYKINDPDDPTEMSKQMADMLSKIVYDVAQCVELYSVHSFNMIDLDASLSDNQVTLKKAL